VFRGSGTDAVQRFGGHASPQVLLHAHQTSAWGHGYWGASPWRERDALQSSIIHSFLVKHLGVKRSTFEGSFDLPLQALADDKDLQVEVLGIALPPEESAASSRTDEGWRTLPDGRRINLNW
jgi:hypothetical protein